MFSVHDCLPSVKTTNKSSRNPTPPLPQSLTAKNFPLPAANEENNLIRGWEAEEKKTKKSKVKWKSSCK